MHAHYMCYHTHTPIHTHVQAMLHANMSSQTNYTSAHIRRLPWRKPCNRAYNIKSNKTAAPFCKVLKSSTLNLKYTIFSHFYSYNLHVNRKQNTNSNYIPAHFYLGKYWYHPSQSFKTITHIVTRTTKTKAIFSAVHCKNTSRVVSTPFSQKTANHTLGYTASWQEQSCMGKISPVSQNLTSEPLTSLSPFPFWRSKYNFLYISYDVDSFSQPFSLMLFKFFTLLFCCHS